jgi:hypothetical protein
MAGGPEDERQVRGLDLFLIGLGWRLPYQEDQGRAGIRWQG